MLLQQKQLSDKYRTLKCHFYGLLFFKVILQFKVQQNKITVLKRKITDLILKTRYRRSESDLILTTPEEIWSYCILITSDAVQYDWNWDPTNSGINKDRNSLHYGTLDHSQRKKYIKKVHKLKSYIKQKGT